LLFEVGYVSKDSILIQHSLLSKVTV